MNLTISDLNPQPIPPRDVTVHLDDAILNDFDRFTQVHKSILDRLGCGGCTSGYIFDWRRLKEFVVNEKLEVFDVQRVGRQIG